MGRLRALAVGLGGFVHLQTMAAKRRPNREDEVVQRLSKALKTRSTAFDQPINPTFHQQLATRRALRPSKRSCPSFYFVFPNMRTPKCYQIPPGREECFAVESPAAEAILLYSGPRETHF